MLRNYIQALGALFLCILSIYCSAQLKTFRFDLQDSVFFTINEKDIPESLSINSDFYCSDSLNAIFFNLGINENSNKLHLVNLNIESGEAKVLFKGLEYPEKEGGKREEDLSFTPRECTYVTDPTLQSELYIIAGRKIWRTSLIDDGNVRYIPSRSELYPFTYIEKDAYVTMSYYKDLYLSKEMQSSICIGNLEEGYTDCESFNPGIINYSYFNNERIADFSSNYLVHGIFSDPIIYLKDHRGVLLDSCSVPHDWVSWNEAVKHYKEDEMKNSDVVDSFGKVILEAASKTNVVRFVNDSTVIHSFMTTPHKVYETLFRIRESKLIPIAKRGPISSFSVAENNGAKDDFPLLTYYGEFFREKLVYVIFTNGKKKGTVDFKCYFYKLSLEE